MAEGGALRWPFSLWEQGHDAVPLRGERGPRGGHAQEAGVEGERPVVITLSAMEEPGQSARRSPGTASPPPGSSPGRLASDHIMHALQQLTQRRAASSTLDTLEPGGALPESTLTSAAAAMTAAADDGETPAAAAERLRLSGPPSADLREIVRWLDQLLPYSVLLGTIFLYYHCTGARRGPLCACHGRQLACNGSDKGAGACEHPALGLR